MTSDGKRVSGAMRVVMGACVALALTPSFFRGTVLGQAFFEVWPHALLDVVVTALAVLVMAINPLASPLVYWPLFILFVGAYLHAEPPVGGWEWFGVTAVMAALGRVVFPRLHTVGPHVVLGLMLGYLGILRVMLPWMNAGESRELLAHQDDRRTAATFLHVLNTFERPRVAADSYRGLLLPGENYRALHEQAANVVTRLHSQHTAQNISFANLAPLRGTGESPAADGVRRIVFPPQDVACTRINGTDGPACTARFSGAWVQLRQGRVEAFDDGFTVTLVR